MLGISSNLPHDAFGIQLSAVEVDIRRFALVSSFADLPYHHLPLIGAQVLQAPKL